MNAANTAAPQQDWELSKENFQPLKAGRKASGLRDNTAELRKQLVEEQKREFWEEIATYSGEDPLEVWLKFIKWTQETFQAGGHKAELLPLLERCTRELQTLPRYKDDIRYLRVWVQYADCLPDPGDVFLFLKENEIGLEHALYYIAYATYLEFRGNYAKADAVYQQGINRLAAPVDRLKAKFAEFQQRMAKRIQRKAQEQQAGGVEFEHPGRHTLGTIGARRNSRAGGGLGGPAALKRKAASPPRPAEQENAGGLAIFTDDEFQEAAPAQSAPAALFAAGRSAAGPWSKLGSFEQSRKENTQHATSWAGQRIKQQPAHSAPPAPALDIPVDPEFQEQAATAGPEAVLNQQEPTLRQRLERGSTRAGHLDEALADDPLRLHRADPSLPPLAPVSVSMSRPALQPKAAEPPEAKRKREEILAFDEAAMSANGEELCFEELRSRAWKSKCPQEQATGTHLTSTCYPGYPYHIPATTIAEPQQANHAPGATLGQPQEQQLQAAAHENRLCEGQGLPSKTGHQAVEPTMTIATRDAFAAVNNMFQGSLPAEYTCLPPNPYAEPTMHTIHGAGYEPTMTLSTRNAFSAINNMFKGSLPNDHTGLPPRSGMPEPTVTINTKAAFEAINGMFGVGGRAGEGRAGSTRQNQGIRDSRVRTRDEPTAPIVIQEDTQFIGGPSSQPAGGFAIREDTQFLPALSAAKPAGGFAIREDTLILPAPSAAKPAGGFAIREDTQFLPAPSAAKPAGGFAIREDTQLLEGFHAKQPQVFNIREDTQFGVGLAGNGFSIKEDTVFINAAPRPAAALGAKRKLGLQAHDSGGTAPAQTAAAAPQEQVSKWGFAPGCDDTLQLDLGETQSLEGLAGQLHPATAVGIKGTSGLSACLQELHIVEDKENTDGPRAVLRDIHAARSAATALQALQDGAAGADAELLLQQNLDGEDSFEVPEEGGSQGSAGSNCGQTSKQHAAAAATVDPGSQLVVVDPFHPSFQPAMLASLEPPVLQWPGVTGCSATEEAKVVAALKGLKKTGSTPIELTLGGECYLVSHQCGQGAYATVYQATTADGSPVALKLEAPPCPWEWYICQVLQARTHEADLRCGFIDPLSLVVGAGSSVLVTPHGGGGSVQDLLNIFLKQGQRPDEVVTMHFAMELLHLLGALHRARVVHADIKPDNLLVRVSHASGEDENAAPSVRLQLIDFGRSVDLELLPEGAVLQGDSGTDAFRCVEMREGTPWLYQADCYGVCGVVHCLLFGDYMEVDRVRDAEGNISLRLRQGFKRYWAQDLWADFFSTLLNHTGGMRPPPATQLLQQFELYLGSTPSVQRKLRNELRRVVSET